MGVEYYPLETFHKMYWIKLGLLVTIIKTDMIKKIKMFCGNILYNLCKIAKRKKINH